MIIDMDAGKGRGFESREEEEPLGGEWGIDSSREMEWVAGNQLGMLDNWRVGVMMARKRCGDELVGGEMEVAKRIGDPTLADDIDCRKE